MPQRTISYSRIVWHNLQQQQGIFSDALTLCLQGLPTSEDTQLAFPGGQASALHRQYGPDRVFIHVAGWDPGSDASVVPHAGAAFLPDVDLAIQAPGNDWDYLGGDGTMLVVGNHCLLVPSARFTQRSMELYVKALFRHSIGRGVNLPDWIDSFNLSLLLMMSQSKAYWN